MQTMARKKKVESGVDSSGHKHRLVGLRLEESVRDKVKALAVAERRSLAMMCVILIEEAMKARGEKQP
jgi:hypothetical protein